MMKRYKFWTVAGNDLASVHLVASDYVGHHLTGVQNLIKKHLESELASHEPLIQLSFIQDAGQQWMNVSNLRVPEIE